MDRTVDRVFLIWVPFSSRSHLLSYAFNAQLCHANYMTKRTLPYTLARYVIALFHTVFTLCRLRPRFIFLMNQPVFLPMIVYCYSKLTRSHYVLDSHSGLFNKRVWRSFLPLMRRIYKGSLLNIAHNEHDAEKYRRWGVRTEVVGTEIYPYESHEKRQLGTSKNVVVIGKFAMDEPVEEIVAAACAFDDVHFYFTGPRERARKRIASKNLPKNVTLTGFLPRDEFVGLVKAADVALVLVTTENTMQMGAWEAMSCGTPLILSDWKILRSTFPRGVVFVRNTRKSIERGIRSFFENREALTRDIVQLKIEKNELWKKEIERIEHILKSYA
jgi:glycosyltransferase involved in cell wall biosynthesis